MARQDGMVFDNLRKGMLDPPPLKPERTGAGFPAPVPARICRKFEGRWALLGFVGPFKIKKFSGMKRRQRFHPCQDGGGKAESENSQNEANLKSQGSPDFLRVSWWFWGRKNEPI
jgi:hypothetical protein